MQRQQQQGAGRGADQKREKEEEELAVLATWDCGSPLYDSFELASLHHVLESHLMVLPFPGAAAVSSSRRFDRLGVVAGGVDVIDRGSARRRPKGGTGRRRKVWTGSRAAAAVFRAVTCWRSL